MGEEDIVDSAYQVLTADGGLYMLPTNFVLYTLITKEKWCSNKENFTFEEALWAVRECEEDPMISRVFIFTGRGNLRRIFRGNGR